MSLKVSGTLTSLLVVYTVCLFIASLQVYLSLFYFTICCSCVVPILAGKIRDIQQAYRYRTFRAHTEQAIDICFTLTNLQETRSYRETEGGKC